MNRGVMAGLLVVAVSGAGLVGCKDQQKCDEALATARKSMQDEFLDMALARQWRDRAGKMCGAGPELETLDKEILDKEAAIIKAAEDKAKAEAEAGQKAIEEAGKVWSGYDDLEDKEKDKKALKKAKKEAQKLEKGLAVEYAKQIRAYNEKQFDKREEALDD